MTDHSRPAVQVSAEFAVQTDLDRDAFHKHGELVMQELLKLESCNTDFTDSTVTTDVRDRHVTIDLYIFASANLDAIQRALDLIRTAVHAAGGITPAWPTVPAGDAPQLEYQERNIHAEPALLAA